MTAAAMREIEAELLQAGHYPIAGVDEAGRGPLAGPLCVAAVILNPHRVPDGLRDSKLVSAKARGALYEQIMAQAIAVSFAYASVAEIDAINIHEATKQAMLRAISGLKVAPGFVLVDGNVLPGPIACPARAVVDGDALSYSVAAASLVAKVRQVEAALEMHRTHPTYGFDKHKGYGTKQHMAALDKHGPSPWHRMSFRPVRKAAEAHRAHGPTEIAET